MGRAAAAGAGLGLQVYGGQALNQHVGGINPAAVAAALAMGARVIWMPTVDASTEQPAGLPRLCSQTPELPSTTYAIPPVDWSTGHHVRQILRLIAEADAVLATGHLSVMEVAWLLDEARLAGISRVLLTHPSYTVPAMSAAQAAELTGQASTPRSPLTSCCASPGVTRRAWQRLSPVLATIAWCCPRTPVNQTIPAPPRRCSCSLMPWPLQASTGKRCSLAPRTSPNASSPSDVADARLLV